MEYWIWKGNIQNLKRISNCFSGDSIVSYLGGTRFKPCLLPFVCSQIFLGLSFITCTYIYNSHLVPIFNMSMYMCDHHPFHIAPSWICPFHTIFTPLPKIFTIAFDAAKEALWLGRLAHTFRQVDSDSAPVVYSDSQGVVALSKIRFITTPPSISTFDITSFGTAPFQGNRFREDIHNR